MDERKFILGLDTHYNIMNNTLWVFSLS